MVIGLTADVFVGLWDKSRWFLRLDLVELGIQDVLDALVGVNAGAKRSAAGGFQAFFAIAAAKTQEAQAGTVGLLRMLAGIKKHLHELGCVRADLLRPARESLR